MEFAPDLMIRDYKLPFYHVTELSRSTEKKIWKII